jgi:hypothetical protein
MRHPAQEGYEIGELLHLLRRVRSSRDHAKQLADRPDAPTTERHPNLRRSEPDTSARPSG